jgi:hypothetical protein
MVNYRAGTLVTSKLPPAGCKIFQIDDWAQLGGNSLVFSLNGLLYCGTHAAASTL